MLIGIDGGGTKTQMVLAALDGKILNACTGPASNMADLGPQEALNRLSYQLDILTQEYSKSEIKSVYAGIAGAGSTVNKQLLSDKLKELFPSAITGGDTDAFSPLYGEAEEGIVVISGTGSCAFSITKEGKHQVGGLGYLIDDAGSGFSIGSQVLKMAYMSYDGRGETTLLNRLCEDKLGAPLSSSIPAIYNGGKTFVASFAPLAFEAAEQGDVAASKIINEAAEALALHIRTCLKYITARPCTAVLSGGLMSNDRYIQLITEHLADAAADIMIIRPKLPQVYGAVAKAAMNAGFTVGADFKLRFTETYKEK